MAGTFYFRKNSTTYKLYSVSNSEFASSGSVENFTACSNFLMCYLNTGSSSSAKSYVPALTTQGTKVYAGLNSDGSQVYYDTSSPTIAFRKNGTTYYCAKSMIIESYDIPAGTYSPSTFKSLIDNYISQNGSRKVSNSFNVTVNGQTITVNANTTIYNENNASSGSSVLSYAVNFSGSYLYAGECFSYDVAHSFGRNKVYITQSTGIPYFGNYRNYNITISTGIKFK